MIWFNTFVAEVTLIEGPSMYPFLNAGYNETLRRDLCLNWKWYAREKLARGMIVTFRYSTYGFWVSSIGWSLILWD